MSGDEALPSEEHRSVPAVRAGKRPWLIVLMAIDALLFLPAAYMAVGALDVALTVRGSPVATAIAALFLALPVFCIAAPLAAWRANRGGQGTRHAIVLTIAPVAYALFLTLFLYSA
jgi:hypothetical protein